MSRGSIEPHGRRRIASIPSIPFLIAMMAGFAVLSSTDCSEQDNPLGFDSGPRGDSLSTPILVSARDSADVEVRPVRSTSGVLSILVGRIDSTGTATTEAEARGLLKFGSLPDTSGMRVAYLRLHVKRGAGDSIGIAVRRVRTGWTASGVRWDSLLAVDDPPIALESGIATGTVGLTNATQLPDIPIPIDLVREWIVSPDENHGIELSWIHGNGIARIVSPSDAITDDSGNRIITPVLILAADSSKAVSRSVSPTAAAYVIHDLRPTPSGSDPTVRIGGGPPSRLLLRFGLADVPRNVSIVRAVLWLPLRPGQVSSDEPLRFLVYQVTQEWSEDAPPPDTTSVLVRSTFDGLKDFNDPDATALTIDIGAIVQRWVKGDANDGIAVRLSDETAAPRGAIFFTREDPDSAHRPTLDVIYLGAPGPRLESLESPESPLSKEGGR